MKLSELCDIAEDNDIDVAYINCPKSGSISLMTEDGTCYIGLDKKVADCETIGKIRLAHELGHCTKGAFYNRYSELDIISKHEYRANKWAAQKLIPYEDFIKACKQGYTETWQLAEYFDVTEDFVRTAYNIYINMGYEFL